MYKILLICSLIFSPSIFAEDYNKYKPYTQYDVNSDKYRTFTARHRANQHPKGSGVGTNKYNVNYNDMYSVEYYKRRYYSNDE